MTLILPSIPDVALDRRQLLRKSTVVAVLAAMPGRLSANDTHHFRHGAFDVTVLSDGEMIVPGTFVAQDAPPAQLTEALSDPAARNPMVHLKANVPLIRHGSDLILVDIGAGRKFQPTEGLLLGALQAHGIDRASITKVIVTHAHPDHLWGMLDPDQKLNFPNASYYVGAREWSFWMDPDVAIRLPQDFRSIVAETQNSLNAIRERMTLVKPGDDIVGGLRVINTPGHTPGHFSLELDGGEGLIITADAVSHDIISFKYPTWHNGFDFDSSAAISTRKALLNRISKDRIKLLVYHLPYPGVGYAEVDAGAFRFVATG